MAKQSVFGSTKIPKWKSHQSRCLLLPRTGLSLDPVPDILASRRSAKPCGNWGCILGLHSVSCLCIHDIPCNYAIQPFPGLHLQELSCTSGHQCKNVDSLVCGLLGPLPRTQY